MSYEGTTDHTSDHRVLPVLGGGGGGGTSGTSHSQLGLITTTSRPGGATVVDHGSISWEG